MSNNIEKKVPTELGTEKVGKLLMLYAIPAIIAQTAASLYNMIDSVFIGHIPDVGAEAISGLATTFPFMNLSAAFGAMVGVGGATQLSVSMEFMAFLTLLVLWLRFTKALMNQRL